MQLGETRLTTRNTVPIYELSGDGKSRLYRIWSSIKCRTSNPNFIAYPRYGGRGIKMCELWQKSYLAFKQWALESHYSDTLTIDRIDNNGDYTPDNCRWATCKEQSANRSTTILITWNGLTQTIDKWASQLNIEPHVLYQRIYYGWDTERLLTTPKLSKQPYRRKITYKGISRTITEWAAESVVSEALFRYRISSGWDIEKALTKPANNKLSLSPAPQEAIEN